MKSDLMVTAPRSGDVAQLRAFIEAYESLALGDEGVAVEVEIAQWRLGKAIEAQTAQAAA